jgi:ABC-2 type transport system permease protein
MRWNRIYALVLKYAYISMRNAFRAMDVCFWPVVDLLVWGFVTLYLLKVSGAVPALITFLIAAVIMWNVLYRAQQVVCLSFLDDLWSRNLLNIFTSPVKVSEFIAAAYILGLIQSVIVITILSAMAVLLYDFNITKLGLALAPLFGNLMLMGWAMGLIATSLIIRFGPQAEVLAWAIPFLVQPLCAVFYPVSVLPQWLQPLAYCVPASYVFEGMRMAISGQHSQVASYALTAFLLNVLYLAFAGVLFKHMFEEARVRGLLAKYCA